MKHVALAFCGMLFFTGAHGQLNDFGTVNFKKADSLAEHYPGFPLNDLKRLSDNLTMPLANDVDKFRAIYKWVCLNIKNDYEYYLLNKRKREKIRNEHALREWDMNFRDRVFDRLLRDHKTVCTGYAYLIKELAYHAGLSCRIVDGYGRTVQSNIGGKGIPNHSWNAVMLKNKWYLCDATWSSGAMNAQTGEFIQAYDDAYFLPDPSLFVLNHYPLDSTLMLIQQKPTLDEFLNGPLTYKQAIRDKWHPAYPVGFDVTARKGSLVTFRFGAESTMQSNDVKLVVARSSAESETSPKVYQDEDGLYCLDHTFATAGAYVVHILSGDNPIFTYRVKVER